MKTISKTRLGIALAVFAAVAYGFWPTAVRGIYANGGNFTFALLITTWARGLSMAIFCMASGRRMFSSREGTLQGVVGGIFQAVTLITVFIALKFIPGPLMIIILFSHTLMLLFFMAWRGEIKLDKVTVLTTVVALAGLSIVIDLWDKQPGGNWIGIALTFVAALTTVSRLYVYGRQTKERHPIVVGAENFLSAAVLVSFAVFYEMPHMPAPEGYGYVLAGCVIYSAATAAMFYGIALMGSFKWSLFAKMEPIFTALFAAFFLHEVLKPTQYIGMLIVTGSLAVYQIAEQKRKARG